LLALETDASRENLARASPTAATQPDIIDPANGRSWAPTFAPDGTLAFLSNRSGTNAVWTIKPGAAQALLFDAGLVDLFRLEYSPDGTELAAAIGREEGVTIKILTADGGTVTSFDSPTLGFGHPNWTPDGKAVIVLDRQRYHEVSIAVDNPAVRNPFGRAPPWGPPQCDRTVFSRRGSTSRAFGRSTREQD
jgi:Tol biopolymer transport system component